MKSDGNGSKHTAIHNLDIDTHPTTPQSQFQSTQRILVRIRPRRRSVENDMGDGADHIRDGTDNPAGAQCGSVVGQIAVVGTAVGRWEGQRFMPAIRSISS